jgi:hypothetical protein
MAAASARFSASTSRGGFTALSSSAVCLSAFWASAILPASSFPELPPVARKADWTSA